MGVDPCGGGPRGGGTVANAGVCHPLESLSTFPYLCHTITCNNSDSGDLYQNMINLQRSLGMVSGVLVKAGLAVWSREMLYKAVVQALLV